MKCNNTTVFLVFVMIILILVIKNNLLTNSKDDIILKNNTKMNQYNQKMKELEYVDVINNQAQNNIKLIEQKAMNDNVIENFQSRELLTSREFQQLANQNLSESEFNAELKVKTLSKKK